MSFFSQKLPVLQLFCSGFLGSLQLFCSCLPFTHKTSKSFEFKSLFFSATTATTKQLQLQQQFYCKHCNNSVGVAVAVAVCSCS